MRYIYTVEGSEDGLIDVFSSLQSALETAKNYVSHDARGRADEAQQLHRNLWMVESSDGRISATVTKLTAKQEPIEF